MPWFLVEVVEAAVEAEEAEEAEAEEAVHCPQSLCIFDRLRAFGCCRIYRCILGPHPGPLLCGTQA